MGKIISKPKYLENKVQETINEKAAKEKKYIPIIKINLAKYSSSRNIERRI